MLLQAIVFITGGAILALELLASRIMTPYFVPDSSLVTALDGWMDRVSRVIYNLDLWESAPRTLEADGGLLQKRGW